VSGSLEEKSENVAGIKISAQQLQASKIEHRKVGRKSRGAEIGLGLCLGNLC
jgi:hypothetical protein